MFDIDDLEEKDPSPDPAEVAREEARQVAAGLGDKMWNVRRDACRKFGELGASLGLLGDEVFPYLRTLVELEKKDEDYEVKKAAKKTVRALAALGVVLPKDGAAGPAASTGAAAPEGGGSTGSSYSGWRTNFRIFKEVLPMRLDREGMTPVEICEVWEKQWGIQYASRIKFEAPEGFDVKWLNAREDVCPRTPFVVGLHCSVGSILDSLSVAMKQFGELTSREAAAERERRKNQLVVEEVRRKEADAKEQERWRKKEARRALRQSGEDGGGQPWKEHRLFSERVLEN